MTERFQPTRQGLLIIQGLKRPGSSAAGAIKFPQTVFSVLTVVVAASYNLANL